MFFELSKPLSFDGKRDFLDISSRLSRFLQAEALSADIGFATDDPAYMSVLAVYNKESVFPDFSLNLAKGRVVLSVRRGGALQLFRGKTAYCDGRKHFLSFRGNAGGVSVCVDGKTEIRDDRPGPWCEFGYVGFASLGRGTLQDFFANYYNGEIWYVRLSDSEERLPNAEERLPKFENHAALKKTVVFKKGMLGVENFRIPMLVTVGGGIVVAGADARMEAPGDNPNHICRALRISRDSGETWEKPRVVLDFGGTGREDGAAAIDGSFLYDDEADVLFMLYSHTPSGIGLKFSEPGTGFDERGRKILADASGGKFFAAADGSISDEAGRSVGYRVDACGRLYGNGLEPGSVSHGPNRILREENTSFLQLAESRDRGESWSAPRELNAKVKEKQMCFLGAGPGTGIRLKNGMYKGRLVFPVYFTVEKGRVSSSAVIYSDNHGRTWQRGKSVSEGCLSEMQFLGTEASAGTRKGVGEAQVVELADGKLLIFLRNSFRKRVGAAVSTDGGASWRDFRFIGELPDPGCQSHAISFNQNGKDIWLFSNPADENRRVKGTVRVSENGVDSWSKGRLVEPGEFGYSCMAQLPDGQIGILYEAADSDLVFAKFTLEWLCSAPPRKQTGEISQG